MKYLVLFMMLALSTTAQDKVVLTPKVPVYCQKQDARSVNWIKDLKVSEDSTNVIVKFKTHIGSCENGISSYNYLARVSAAVTPDGIRIPFVKQGYKVNTSSLDATTYVIDLTFKKSIIFKKKTERNFTVTIGYDNLSYPWNVNIVKRSNSESAVVKIK